MWRSGEFHTITLYISKISAGYDHSLFQNNKGEIFECGYNKHGECGLGHFDSPQITPSFPIHLQTLLNLFVDLTIIYFLMHLLMLFNLYVEITKIYFLIPKEMYILLGIMSMVNLVLVTIQIRMYGVRCLIFRPFKQYHV